MTLRFFVTVLVCLALGRVASAGCPSYVDLGPIIGNVNTKDLRLFRIANEKRGWQGMPMQVDALPEGIDKKGKQLRASLDPRQFGSRHRRSDGVPCQGDILVEFRDPTRFDRFAYLARCGNQKDRLESIPVSYDGESLLIASDQYRYRFVPEKHLLFSEFGLVHPKSGKKLVAAEDSRVNLHFDVRNFWSLDFDMKRVESVLESMHAGSMGAVGVVHHYLNILFFRIDLEASSVLSFHRDSANIPMIIQSPVNAPDYVYPGSGTLYSFRPTKETTFHLSRSRIPMFDSKIVKKGGKSFVRKGLAYCDRKGSCTYQIVGTSQGQPFSMNFTLDRSVVKHGFFPLFVSDLKKVRDDLDWDIEWDEKKGERVGVYYEVSGLPEGNHLMDFWIGLDSSVRQCPHPVVPQKFKRQRILQVIDEP